MTITHFPLQAHCFAFGGFELQMLAAHNAVDRVARTNKDYGHIHVGKIDVWDRAANFDIGHFWGLSYVNASNVYWAKKAGKKVVITSLFGSYETFSSRVRHYVSSTIYTVRVNKELIPSLDVLVVVSEDQKKVAVDLFKVPAEKVQIIPNVVQDRFFAGSGGDTTSQLPFERYILATGNVCSRKNQVALAKAAIRANVNLIIAGKVMEGEERYGAELEKLTAEHSNIHWYKGLPENSDLLVDLVKNCTAFVLPSYAETQPISLLEAAAAQKPLVISDRRFAYQKYYGNACIINPASISSIEEGIKEAVNNSAAHIAPAASIEECREQKVGLSYIEIYEKLMHG